MDEVVVRLRILEALIPQAARSDIQGPEKLVETCKHLENYVLHSDGTGVDNGRTAPPNQQGKQSRRRGNS